MKPAMRVEHTVAIPAPPERVMGMMTDAGALERWFAPGGRVRFEPYEGGTVEFVDHPFGRVNGSVAELESDRLTITFQRGWPGILTIRLSPQYDGSTAVDLVHDGFDAAGYDERGVRGFALGWEDRLADLRSLVEGG